MISLPDVPANLDLLRQFFANNSGQANAELRNPHPEQPVSASVRDSARASAVLIAIVDKPEPTVLVTRRHANIRFAGHICFPGGTRDPEDESDLATALREAEEEIGLTAESLEILGELGIYYSQAGYKITPVVALVKPGFQLVAHPAEVEEIYEVGLAGMLQSENYRLTWHTKNRGHYAFTEGDVRIAGPTVSIMIGLYEALVEWTEATGC